MASIGNLLPDELPSSILRTQRLALKIIVCLGLHEVQALASTLRALVPLCVVNAARRRKRIQIIGGSDGRGPFRTSESMDPQACGEAGGAWEPVPAADVEHGRSIAAGGILSGCFYMCGGWNGSAFLSSVDCFDPAHQCWFQKPSMSEARGSATGCVTAGRLYVSGGRSDAGYLDTVECYDPLLNAWAPIAPMSEPRGSATSGRVEGLLYVCGGFSRKRTLASAERFDPNLGCWEILPAMMQPRTSAACSALRGSLFVCGGSCPGASDGGVLKTVERFDLRNNSWSESRALAGPRTLAVAVTIAGRLFVCGGFDGRNYIGTVERYNYETGLWDFVATMLNRRAGAIAGVMD